MLFHSLEFAAFAAIVYALYFALGSRLRLQNGMLLVASYAFYAAWDWRFLFLIAVSTVVDFVVGVRLSRTPPGSPSSDRRRKRLLAASLVTNLGILGTFKYFDFFVESAALLLSRIGLETDVGTLGLILPVGISFYTFQTLSYTIDVYRGRCEPTEDLVEFALFVAYFPQLVAGPIERASHLLPQLQRPRVVRPNDVSVGVHLILWGLVLKLAVADNAAVIVNEVYGNPEAYGGLDIVVATSAFAVQIYGDFAGYSAIARGLARLMGIDLMVNFRIPYVATSPSDFWQRWHISLSTWLRDYLYIPLGGNRGAKWKTYRNLAITMLLGGLWHGAAWNFVLWGAFHGALLVVWRLVEERVSEIPEERSLLRGARKFGAWATMFGFTLYGWLLFRAESMADIADLTAGAFTRSSVASVELLSYLLAVAWPMLLFDALRHTTGNLLVLTRYAWPVRAVVYAMLVAWLLTHGAREPIEFIYFAF